MSFVPISDHELQEGDVVVGAGGLAFSQLKENACVGDQEPQRREYPEVQMKHDEPSALCAAVILDRIQRSADAAYTTEAVRN